MNTLYQKEVWTTRDGRTMRLEEMTRGHRENLLAYLERNIESIRFRLGWYWAVELGLHEGGDAAHDALEREAAFVDNAPAAELLESLPLVKRLRWLNRTVHLYRSVSGADFEGTMHYDCRLHGDECYGCAYEKEWTELWAGNNPANRILVMLREAVADWDEDEQADGPFEDRYHRWLEYVETGAVEPEEGYPSGWEFSHAHKVLTRLARLAEEANAYDQD